MKSMLLYLAQVFLASGILYAYYHFFLRNGKFHLYNRFYLLVVVLISIIVPFLQIPIYFSSTEPSVVLQTWQSLSEGGPVLINFNDTSGNADFNWNLLVYVFYVIVAILFFIKLLFSLLRIITLLRKNPVKELSGVHFVNTNEPDSPFSFFRWLFWNRKLDLSSEQGEQVFRHEVFHIRQKHSLDLIFIELITVILWINPFFHLIKKELKTIHEFLADRFATTEENKWEYSELLLMQALQTRRQLVNPFFHTQIKRRIAMITTPQKTSYQYLRKLLVLPIAALLICLLAFRYTDRLNNDVKNEAPLKESNVQESSIDAKVLPAIKDPIEKTRSFTPNAVSVADTTPKKVVVVQGYNLEASGGIMIDGKEPLYVIDNVVQPRDAASYKKIKELDPKTISSINILKDSSALLKYGKDGKNGVVEIITKKLTKITTDSPGMTKPALEEVVVTGYALNRTTDLAKPAASLEEVVVTGYGSNKVVGSVDEEPFFPGGQKGWNSFLMRNLDGSIPLKKHAPAGTYIVYIQFLVMADGSIHNVKALTNHGFGMEEEAIRVIQKGPNWKPAMQNGKAVNAYKKQAIAFAIVEEQTPATSIE